jgi:hypothetical protein
MRPTQARPALGGTAAVLACLSRYTHRVAIANRRLTAVDADTVSFTRAIEKPAREHSWRAAFGWSTII